MEHKIPQITVTEPEIEPELTVFASLLPVTTGLAARKNNVSRQPSNSSRREGTFKGPRGIQAFDRREVRDAILHHIARWEGCSSVSLRGVAADRGEAGEALQFQSDEEKVFEPHQLLRSAGGNRWAGPGADTSVAARVGEDSGRGGRCGQPHVPRGAAHRGLQERYRREPV